MQLLNIVLQITDYGPIYAETPPQLSEHSLLVEPWNSLSSLFIAIPGLLFLLRVKPGQKGRGFIYFAAAMLFIGGTGSTLFHGLRTSRWLVIMDFLPIVIVSVAVALVFWQKVVKSWPLAILIIVGLLAIRGMLYYQQENLGIKGQGLINISYFLSGITIFLPCLIFLVQSRFYKSGYLFAAIGLMLLALIFRTIDKEFSLSWLPQGTHFLWHIASGIGAWYMGLYVLAALALPQKQRA